MTNPLIRPLIRPLIGTVNINRITSGANLYLNFFDDQYIINKKQEVDIDVAVVEGRATTSLVLDGDGFYSSVGANEPAQGDGVGLQVSEDMTNLLIQSRRVGGKETNPTPVPVLSSETTVFNDTAGWTWAVGTNTAKAQTNQSVSPAGAKITLSFLAKPLGAGVQIRDVEGTGIIGPGGNIDRSGYVFDFDTLTTMTGHGPDIVTALPNGWYRLSFIYQDDGTATLAVYILFPFSEAVKNNVVFDQFQWTVGGFEPPVIVTTGSAVTRDADEPVVADSSLPWSTFDLANGALVQQVNATADIVGVDVITLSDGTANNFLTVRRGSSDGVEVECVSGGSQLFIAESATTFPAVESTIDLSFGSNFTHVALDGASLDDLTQALALPSFTQLDLSCSNGTDTIKRLSGFNGASLVVFWGDSFTESAGATTLKNKYPNQVSGRIGSRSTIFNGGVGGDTSTQIKTRFDAAPELQPAPTIIWSGRNNYTDPTQVKADIAAMVATLGHTNYLILSILNGNGEITGTTAHTTIVALNSDLDTLYGVKFVDVRTPLVDAGNGGDPTDQQNYDDDVPANSLRSDAVHLNNEGYALVGKTVYAKISELGL